MTECLAVWQAFPRTAPASAGQATQISQNMMPWQLEALFKKLPSDAHRQMFLDTALLLHGQPFSHLQAAWTAQLQGRQNILSKQRQQSRADTVAMTLFDDLERASFVSLDSENRCAAEPLRRAVKVT